MPAGPAHPERVDPAHDDIGPIERLLGLLELEGSGRPGDLEVEARMHPRLLDAVDGKRVYSRSLKTSGVPSGSKMPTLAPPVPKSMPRRYGPSVITVLLSRKGPAQRIADRLSPILPAE